MKKSLSVIFSSCFLLFHQCLAQTFISIPWQAPDKILTSNGKEVVALSFTGAAYLGTCIPVLVLTHTGAGNAIKVTDLIASELSEEEAGLIPESFVEEEFSVITTSGLERKKTVYRSYISTIRYNKSKGRYEKLISFSYKFYSQDEAFMSLSGNRSGRTANKSFSVLSSGDWYKILVESSGIYKIDYNYLRSIGIDPDKVNPQKIRIFGNGGGMLPQLNSEPRPDDLTENAIYIYGEEDGVFNKGDYILFYGSGPDQIKYDSLSGSFTHIINIYSKFSGYFINIGQEPGLRIATGHSGFSPQKVITTFNDYVYHELNNTNILHSGRDWFGEKLDYLDPSKTVKIPLPGLSATSDIRIGISLMSAAPVTTSFNVQLNGIFLGNYEVKRIDEFHRTYTLKGRKVGGNTELNPSRLINTSMLDFTISYDYGGSSASTGYIDNIRVNCERQLALYGRQTRFRSLSSKQYTMVEYSVGNCTAATSIWDITDPLRPVEVIHTLMDTQARFVYSGGDLKEFIVFSGSDFPPPVFLGRIENQNLHGINTHPEMLIITSDQLVGQASKLASHRKSYSGLDVEVVAISKIFNEFSSGVQDVTAVRDFVKMIYDRGAAMGFPLKYLLLFGDCTYDYKNNTSNITYVPVYESRESLNPVATYSSEDYFGFMDADEGLWPENGISNEYLDLGIGRIPAGSAEEAEQAVNKIIHYDLSKSCIGKWRNRIILSADDGDNNDYLNDCENLSDIIQNINPRFNVSKIYLDAYPQYSTTSSENSEQAKREITQQIEKGVLVFNYVGHGGVTGLSQEGILDLNDIRNWKNYDNLPFLITATCEFGTYDNPAFSSAGEVAMLKAGGGVIGLMTTTRMVFSGSNYTINSILYLYLLSKSDKKWLTMGEILRLTKNSDTKSGINNRNYTLLGDPSQTLAYPELDIEVTTVKDFSANPVSDTLKALSRIKIEGFVKDGDVMAEDFNGSIFLTVFDKPVTITTLGNESKVTNFRNMGSSIFEGKSSVTNGVFQCSFVVPKDIDYLYGQGKISLYGMDKELNTDASGYYNQIVIGGTDENAPDDNTPPSVSAFINDDSFVNGGSCSESPILLVKLSDENGINISTSGIGHEISAFLDHSEKPIILNDYYIAETDDFSKGVVEYPLKSLMPGNHHLRIKAWDTHNNSSEYNLEFVVVNDENISIRNVLNYPNPFSTSTSFHFDHNRYGDDLQVKVQIFTVSGKLVRTLFHEFYLSNSHIGEVYWDGKDDFGDQLGRGVYVYKIEVKSLRDGAKAEKYQKLVILR